MENKYYTPELEEFHKGFEVAIVTKWTIRDGKEVPVKYSHTPVNVIDDKVKLMLKDGILKVKYLDKEDIEGFGFILSEEKDPYGRTVYKANVPDRFAFNHGTIYVIAIDFRRPEFVEIKSESYSSYGAENNWMRFRIKNKSELKRVLKQIGYEGAQIK